MSPDRLGEMMMGANLFAGISALAATPLVGKVRSSSRDVRGACAGVE
jgi:hypothetical protein